LGCALDFGVTVNEEKNERYLSPTDDHAPQTDEMISAASERQMDKVFENGCFDNFFFGRHLNLMFVWSRSFSSRRLGLG
jgi:hypothetical protein